MQEKGKLQVLLELEKKHNEERKEIKSIWDLLCSIHALPGLREWVTLESKALIPYIQKCNDSEQAVVHMLFSVPASNSKNNDKTYLIWGYAEAMWPSCKVIYKKRIEEEIKDVNYEIDESYICKKEFADKIEKAYKENLKLDLPEGLQQIYDIEQQKKNEEKEIENNSKTNVDYSRLFTILNEIEQIIDEAGQPHMKKELRRAYSRASSSDFSLAVVGEFSRGKSTLINKLLKKDILPVDVLPTTAMITKVMYGNKPALYRIFPDGNENKLILSDEVWKNLIADENGNDPEGFVKVEFPDEWLKDTGINIIDTPGAGDIFGKRAQLTIDTIASCDAVLITVNATKPLSLTEKAFIQQHVLSRKIPKISIVITHLDRIPDNNKESVIKYIKKKAFGISKNIKICVSQDISSCSSDDLVFAAGTEAIKNMIKEWTLDKDAVNLRNSQIVFQINELLNILKESIIFEKNTVNLSNEEKMKLMDLDRGKIEQHRMDWEDLILEMKKREINCENYIIKAMEQSREKIIESLKYELRHCPNPRSWWEQDLQMRLRERISSAAMRCEKSLQNIIAKDANWLEYSVNEMFKSKMNIKPNSNLFETCEVPIRPEADKLLDLKQLRILTRIGFGATTIAGYLLFGPIGMAVNIGGSILNEKIFSKNLEKQRILLSSSIDEIVRSIFDRSSEITKQRLKVVYSRIINEIKNQELIWIEASVNALNNSRKIDTESVYRLNKQLANIEEFHKEINQWLEVI